MASAPLDLASLSAAILAGGRGERLGGLDKGLQPIFGRPLVAHVIDALRPQCAEMIICANRNQEQYAEFAKVIKDDFPGFRGPLAGISTALSHCRTDWMLTVSVDTPWLPPDLAARLSAAIDEHRPVVAHDGSRRQPLFALYSRALADSARHALERDLGVWQWQKELRAIEIDFSDERERFENLNTVEDFVQSEQRHHE